ncbi:MAG TPA: putative Ig domain-containing protein, partial [Vicinamibacterales bacterium]|nr:putative Ig domain-containing protein [Vicinamibacterales bacterium]
MNGTRQLGKWLGIVALGIVLGACVEEEGDTAAAADGNRAPMIAGTPATSVALGATYSFIPSAADPDGDPLIFGIDGKPAWATFSTSTGQLSGTPAPVDVGVNRRVVLWVSDGDAESLLPAFDLTVAGTPAANRAPVISGTAATSVVAGSAYTFTPTASDADGNALTFSIAGRPSWAAFDPQTGRISGTPAIASVGTFANVVISVSDGMAAASLAPFSITVTALTANRPPTISGTPATAATQGTLYSFQPTAADADSDTLTFAIANRPTWATFNANTGLLRGTPGATHVQSYSNIVISVSDGTASTPLPAFSIAVASANTAPTITGTPPTTAAVGTQYSFTPTANDANGGTLTFSITNRPSWATFTTSTGRLQGTPTTANVGTFANIVISVSDGQESRSLAPFSITVNDVPNRAPTISGTPSTAVMQGTQYSFTPTASDPDTDTLTFSIANPPAWATFNTSTGRLQGTPDAGDVGTTSGIVITVSDGELTTALAAFSLTVQAVAMGSATLRWTAPTQNSDGSPLTDLAGYKIYWGPAQNNYPNSVTLDNPGLTTYVVENLVPGTYFFSATAL